MRIRRIRGAALLLLTGLVASLTATGTAAAQDAKSAAAAAALTKQLDQAKLQHLATHDPDDPNRFIAVMYLPGLQMITVSAKYSVPVLLNEKLLKKNYQDVYLDLSSASERDSRIIIDDLRADGLPVDKDKANAGEAYEKGAARVVFDWDWKKQKLTEKEYLDKLAEADALYARMLGLLLAEVKKGGS
jgi:hypothetical protein